MAGFEPESSVIGSDRSANCATTTAHCLAYCLFRPFIFQNFFVPLRTSNTILSLCLSRSIEMTGDSVLPKIFEFCYSKKILSFIGECYLTQLLTAIRGLRGYCNGIRTQTFASGRNSTHIFFLFYSKDDRYNNRNKLQATEESFTILHWLSPDSKPPQAILITKRFKCTCLIAREYLSMELCSRRIQYNWIDPTVKYVQNIGTHMLHDFGRGLS